MIFEYLFREEELQVEVGVFTNIGDSLFLNIAPPRWVDRSL